MASRQIMHVSLAAGQVYSLRTRDGLSRQPHRNDRDMDPENDPDEGQQEYPRKESH